MALSTRGSDEMLLNLTRNAMVFISLIFQMQDLLYVYVIKKKQMHNNILLHYTKIKLKKNKIKEKRRNIKKMKMLLAIKTLRIYPSFCYKTALKKLSFLQ